MPANEHAISGGMFFINEWQPSGDYDLLKIPLLNDQFSSRTLTASMYNVTEADAEAEREDRLFFPEMDLILELAHPDSKTFVAQLADAALLTNQPYMEKYADILTQQFEKVEQSN